MKIKKHFTYSSSHQIWRIIINEFDKLILETRDMKSKEFFFHCFDLNSGKTLFKNFQTEEKHWIGIDAVYKDKIFFHKFPKPDMPGHKEIIAFDINSKKELWKNDDLSFLFAFEDKVYGFKQGFEERFFYALDIRNGELAEDIGSDFEQINELQAKSEREKNWSNYRYPQNFQNADEKLKEVIQKQIGTLSSEGDVEFQVVGDILLFNFHIIKENNLYDNLFFALDVNSGKELLNEKLNKDATSLFKDAFFIYKNFLFLLKEKNEVKIFNMV